MKKSQKHTTCKNKIKPHKKKQNSFYKEALYILLKSMAVFAVLFLLAFITFSVVRLRGHKQLQNDTVGSASDMQMGNRRYHTEELDPGLDVTEGDAADASEGIEEKEGRVFYKGKAYDFNEDIMTFLVMGIDQHSETVQEQEEGFGGGSADAIFLVVLNPHTKKMEILAIDRNTMTDVDIYDYYGLYLETIKTQICVQHGYGDGTVKSAQYMEKAVSNFMYGLPINGYCAINMSAVEKINDAVGGVDVKVLDDLTKWDKDMEKGRTVHLDGKKAFLYVQRRDTNIFGSAEGRLERQRQYIGAFIGQAKEKFKKDPSFPVTLFRELGPYMTTDLNLEKVAYLAGMAADFDFGSMDIRKVEGENVMGEKYEEFYVDETALYELILDVFYEEAG